MHALRRGETTWDHGFLASMWKSVIFFFKQGKVFWGGSNSKDSANRWYKRIEKQIEKQKVKTSPMNSYQFRRTSQTEHIFICAWNQS